MLAVELHDLVRGRLDGFVHGFDFAILDEHLAGLERRTGDGVDCGASEQNGFGVQWIEKGNEEQQDEKDAERGAGQPAAWFRNTRLELGRFEVRGGPRTDPVRSAWKGALDFELF